ncbi:hypothetical protein HY251_03920 [bacterium]|nr:hypothetical protein [bacterium]
MSEARALARCTGAALLLLLPGCAYHVGFRPAIAERDIAVPIFENRTLRRGYEYALTTHVRRRILDQTPLQLAHEASAKAVLKGTIVFVSDGIVIPAPIADPTAPPIESSIVISVEVAVMRRGTLVVGADSSGEGGSPDSPVVLTESQNFVPAFGQSRDSAADKALRKLAERIVDLLEAGWGGAQER